MNYSTAIPNHADGGKVSQIDSSCGKDSRLQGLLLITLAFTLSLGIFMVYQNLVVIPALKKPQVLTAAPPMLREVRGARETRGQSGGTTQVALSINVPKNMPVRVAFDIPPGGYDFYNVEVFSQSGIKKLSSLVSAGAATNTVQILFPAGVLDPGQYSIVVQGGAIGGTIIAQYSFEIQYEK